MKKRYAIVRVDGRHKPSHFECERIENISDLKILDEVVKDYGDTKEQLIRKVAQVLFRRRLGLYNLIWGGVPSKMEAERYYEVRLETAKEIVEFLGVK